MPEKITTYKCKLCKTEYNNYEDAKKCEDMPVEKITLKHGKIVEVEFSSRRSVNKTDRGLAVIVNPNCNTPVHRIEDKGKFHHGKMCMVILGLPFYDCRTGHARGWSYGIKLFPWNIIKVITKNDIPRLINKCKKEIKEKEKRVKIISKEIKDSTEKYEEIERKLTSRYEEPPRSLWVKFMHKLPEEKDFLERDIEALKLTIDILKGKKKII